jgi:hypothetical protein
MNEADTCRIYVEPKLRAEGWETSPAEPDALLPAALDRAFRGAF